MPLSRAMRGDNSGSMQPSNPEQTHQNAECVQVDQECAGPSQSGIQHRPAPQSLQLMPVHLPGTIRIMAMRAARLLSSSQPCRYIATA